MKHVLIIILYVGCNQAAFGQDQLFSQFYNSPLNLNPAFTGCAKNEFRANIDIKRQWTRLYAPLQAYSLSMDKYFMGSKVSSGVVVNHYQEGYLKTTGLGFIFAKNFGSNGEEDSQNWFLNFAMQAGPVWRNADRNRYLFPDQLNQNGPNGQVSGAEVFVNNGKSYLDISSGAIFVYRKLMVGASWYHMNNPNTGLAGNTNEGHLPGRFNFHASYMLTDRTDQAVFVKPTIIMQRQGINRQFAMGGIFSFREAPFECGIWYNNNLSTGDSHSVSFSLHLNLVKFREVFFPDAVERLRAGAGYEWSIAKPQSRYTGGSGEFSMLYETNLSTNGVCPKPWGTDKSLYPWMFH